MRPCTPIAARSQSAEDLQQFFAAIQHRRQLMNARNFYIALYDPQAQLLSFPYLSMKRILPLPQDSGSWFDEYVLRSGEPLLATPAVFEELMRRGEVESIGTPVAGLAGRPLKSGTACIGVLVVQTTAKHPLCRA